MTPAFLQGLQGGLQDELQGGLQGLPPPQRPLRPPGGLPPPPMARGGDEGTAAGAEGAAEGAAAVETGSRAAAEAPLERLLQEEVRSLLPGAAELRERAELSRQLEAVIKAGWEGGQLDLASLGWRAAHPNPSPPKPNPNPNPIPNLNPHPSLKPKL